MINTSVFSPEEKIFYDKLVSTLPAVLTESDLSIYLALFTLLSAATQSRLDYMYRQFDIATADEYYLRMIAEFIGYKWISNISVEANRTRMMYHSYRRKYRGTVEAIKNIVRLSNDDRFINNAENANIIVQEGTPLPLGYNEALTQNIGTTTVNITAENSDDYIPYLMMMYQHVITLHVPEEFIIDRAELDEVRPAGTLIYFAYHVLLKLTHNLLAPLENNNKLIYIRSPFKLDQFDLHGLNNSVGKRLTLPVVSLTNTADHLIQFDVQLTITTE